MLRGTRRALASMIAILLALAVCPMPVVWANDDAAVSEVTHAVEGDVRGESDDSELLIGSDGEADRPSIDESPSVPKSSDEIGAGREGEDGELPDSVD